jgi:hypothetical protein
MNATENTTTSAPHWAAAIGRQVAARRAAHQAEAAAEAEATGQRAIVPVAELVRRFAAVAVRVLEAVDAFGEAAGIEITSEPTGADLVLLQSGADRLELRREDETARVRLRALSRGNEFGVDLDGEAFDAEPPARRIAGEFIALLSITHGGPHVHAQ